VCKSTGSSSGSGRLRGRPVKETRDQGRRPASPHR
jgi:hypothetical protein